MASAAARISSAVTAASRSYHSTSELAARVASGWPVVTDLKDRKGATGAPNDDALLAELGRLGRLWRFGRRFGFERSERRGGALEELTGRCVARDDEVRIVRRVVPAVMGVETVARHQLDLLFASDDALPVGMA